MFEFVTSMLRPRKVARRGRGSNHGLEGTRAAILATDGFEQSELFEPKAALEAAGVLVYVIAPKAGKIKAWDEDDWGKSIKVDLTIEQAFGVEFDFLVLPGGVLNPDKLRNEPNAVAFAQSFINKNKPIAAICHGIQTLIETDGLRGRSLTSWPSLRTDLINAGADWVDREVVCDGPLITSRKPADIPAFNQAMLAEFGSFADGKEDRVVTAPADLPH
jgi:protease I